MVYYFVFELKKLLANRQFIFAVILLFVLTALYQYNLFLVIVERYAIIARKNPSTLFGTYFYESLSLRVNFILIIGTAVFSILVWESETSETLRRAFKLTLGKVTFFLSSKLLIVLLLMFLQIAVLYGIITIGIVPFGPMLRTQFIFQPTRLLLFLGIQYGWLLAILLLNTYWYVLLGEHRVIVFIFSVTGVYLLRFISFIPYYALFEHTYLNSAQISFSSIIWVAIWTLGSFVFVRKQILSYA